MRVTLPCLLLISACLPARDFTGVSCEPLTGCEAPWRCLEREGRFQCTQAEAGVDAGSPDAGAVDAGAVDAGAVDAGPVDAGALDAGTLDAGTLDAGSPDAGWLPPGVNAGVGLRFVDLEPDGVLDALYCEPGSPIISVWRGADARPLNPTVATEELDAGLNVTEVVAVNLDHDPGLELLVLPTDRSGARVFSRSTQGVWVGRPWTEVPGVVVAADVVDLDADGIPELVLTSESAMWRPLEVYRIAGDGGVSRWKELESLQLETVRGLRHTPVPGGTLVVSFGTAGFRGRVLDATATTVRQHNHSNRFTALTRVASTDPQRLFVGVDENRRLWNFNGAPDASVDLTLVNTGSSSQLHELDAGPAGDVLMGDFRRSSAELTPAVVVAAPARALSYAWREFVSGGPFPGDRWVASPGVPWVGPVSGLALVAASPTAPVDLFVVGGSPRTLMRVAGQP